MSLLQLSKTLTALVLILVLATTAACSNGSTKQPTNLPAISGICPIERGNSPAGQDFGNWVVQTAKGLVKDAYVRDNNKLGVVITQVSPNEVKP